MKAYLLVGLKAAPKKPGVFDSREPHVSAGLFETPGAAKAWVDELRLPTEWPYYAVIERDVRFYVLASRILTSSQIHGLGDRLGGSPEGEWRGLIIVAGPFEDPALARRALLLVPLDLLREEKITGVHVGSLEDRDAAQLADLRRRSMMEDRMITEECQFCGILRTGEEDRHCARQAGPSPQHLWIPRRPLAPGRPEFPEDVWSAFHRVWSFAIGKKGYDKKLFQSMEAELLRMHREGEE